MDDIRPPETIKRYAVHSERRTLPDGRIFTRSFIVIKNGYGVIERFTRLHSYIGVYSNKTYKPIQANPEAKLYFIVSMLNYIIVDHGKELGASHVFDITKPMLEKYFNDYAQNEGSAGSYRSEETVSMCIRTVTSFMARLCSRFRGQMSIDKSELFIEKTYVSKRGRKMTKRIPAFQATGVPVNKVIFRDIPTKALEILLPLAFRYAPDIAFGLCLQAFAGLRASEVCNVRQECSPIGAGLQFTEIGGVTREIGIDLTKEVILRSDGAEVGRIKRERIQKVYPAFIGTVLKAYDLHKAYLKTVSYEPDYAPMFVNSYGKAMTYELYRRKFKSLVNEYLRPKLICSDDPELRIYGQMLYEHHLGTHSLRHWYTVQLVLRGENIAGVQSWRGDKSPESAFVYLQNKGDLVRVLEETNERLMDLLLEVGSELYNTNMD